MTTLDDLQRVPARAGRSPLSTSVVIWCVSLLALWRCCPYLGRVPLLVLAAGSVTCAIGYVLRRLPAHRAQVFAALAVIAFYTCSALTSVKPEELTSVKAASDHTSFYQGLSENLLQLELTLPVEPDQRLLAAANPYNPARDYPFVWDAAYYHGRYYVYHGIAPVLTLFLPFRIITQRSLPIQFGLLVFLSAGFVGSLCVLERARAACGLRRPNVAIQVLSVLLLGFASMSPIVLRRPSVYEVAIGSAYCFLMWGCNFLIIQSRRRDAASALLASLCFGLCAASRPTYGVVGGAPVAGLCDASPRTLEVRALGGNLSKLAATGAVRSARVSDRALQQGAFRLLDAVRGTLPAQSPRHVQREDERREYAARCRLLPVLAAPFLDALSRCECGSAHPTISIGTPRGHSRGSPRRFWNDSRDLFSGARTARSLVPSELPPARLHDHAVGFRWFDASRGVQLWGECALPTRLRASAAAGEHPGILRGWRARRVLVACILRVALDTRSVFLDHGRHAGFDFRLSGWGFTQDHPSLYQMLRTLAWPEGKQFDAQ